MQGTPSNADAAALYLRIPYSNPYDIGWFDAIYAGEIKDNKGNVVIAEGTTLPQTDIQLEQMDWLVEGVVGSIS